LGWRANDPLGLSLDLNGVDHFSAIVLARPRLHCGYNHETDGNEECFMAKLGTALWKGKAELTLIGLVVLIGVAA
jgi:hypothetical protein